MTTMISNLPSDLIEEILSRVPLKSMRAVQLTCKKWNTLSKSESFVKMHIGKATTSTREGESTMITMMDHKLYLISVVVDNVDPFIEIKGKLTCSEGQVKISKVFHCEGLLLCILEDDTTTRLVVWNPYWGQTRSIVPRYSHRLFDARNNLSWDMFNYSFGYENKNSRRSYKFLRFIDYHRHRFGNSYMPYPENKFFCYEIYDFDSDLWTTLDVVDPHWCIPFSRSGVTLKGNTYWSAAERSGNYFNHIICFDFTKERFGPLLPPPSSVRDHGSLTLSCVREEKLAGLFQRDGRSYEDELEIWITSKLEAETVSWSKFLRVDTGPPIHMISFFIDEEKKLAMGFNDNLRAINIIGDAGYSRELDLGVHAERICWPKVCSYVPSSVQIKEPARGYWQKGQSSLEMRRFEENMIRLAALEKEVSTRYEGIRLVTSYET